MPNTLVLLCLLVLTSPALAQQTDAAQPWGFDCVQAGAPAARKSCRNPLELPAAAGEQATSLEISSAGRYAIGAQSKTGVALELIDYTNGPVARDGAPGQRDGRIDTFLDQGLYKLIMRGALVAPGAATVTVKPFAEREVQPRRLPPLETLATDLDDYQQRSYWLEIKERGPVFLEAGGRFLDSIHLWRDGLMLLDTVSERRTLVPRPDRPLTVLTLDTVLDPGFYRVTLYGGRERAPWTEQSAEKPLYLRLGVPRYESATRQWRAIGPLGSDRFIVAAKSSDFGRLELPSAAAVRGEMAYLAPAGTQQAAGGAFSFTKTTRSPVWETTFDPERDRLITVQGSEGQTYGWQSFQRLGGDSPLGEGSYWLNLLSAGDERDSAPLTAVLAWRRNPNDPARPDWRVLASNAPRFGTDSTWRGRFNLLGSTELLIEIAAAGDFVIETEGVPLTATLKPLLVADDPNVKPRAGPRWSLETGFYRLRLEPDRDSRGVVSVLFQAANLPAGGGQATSIPPARFPSLRVPANARLFFNQRPKVTSGLVQRDLPLSLKEPLLVSLAAGEHMELTTVVPGKGVITAADERGQAQPLAVDGGTPATQANVAAGQRMIRLSGPGEDGAVFSLSWRAEPVSPAPLPSGLGQAPRQALPLLREDQPSALDLIAEREQWMAIEVKEPGLYRLETNGRLHTSGRLRTNLLSSIAKVQANGIGHNFLIQHYLRAGRYLLGVTSREGTGGRAQVLLRRAPLSDGGSLSFTTPTRATLAAGEGVTYRLAVPPPGGTYQIQAGGLARGYALRLEDAEGWPVQTPGQMGSLTAELQAGDYRMVIMPADVAGRVLVNVVAPAADPTAPQGHGPHPLTLNNPQTHRWLEPPREGDERVPDQWEFALAGETELRLDITDGMRGELQRLDDQQRWQSLARFADNQDYTGRVPAGRYRLLCEALGRNNQLDYTLGAWTQELQPDQPRRLDTLPARIPLSIGAERVVEIASLGRRDTRATLRDATGQVLARGDDRADGWDFLISRQLQAGHYELTVEAVDADKDETEATAEESETATEQEPAEMEGDDATATGPTVRAGDRNGWIDEGEVWVALRLPDEAPAPPLPAQGDVELGNGAVRVFPLSRGEGTVCRLFTGRSSGELTLALEEQDAAGIWRVVDTAAGRSAWLALLTDPEGRERRLRVWGNDGGRAPILLQSRVLAAKPRPLAKAVAWERIAGVEPALGVALLDLAAPHALRLPLADPSLRVASQPGAPLRAVPDDTLIPQEKRLWLVKPLLADESLTLLPVTPSGQETVQLTIPAGRAARLPAEPSRQDRLILWQAESRLGQPGISAGGGMGVAVDSAVAAGTAEEIKIWNAGDGALPLPVAVRRFDLRLVVPQAVEVGLGGVQLAAGEARLLRLPAGFKRARLELPARTAAILGWGGPAPRTLWTGDELLSYGFDLEAESMLVANLGEGSAPLSWSLVSLPAEQAERLRPATLFRRFEPTAGVLLLPVEGAAEELIVQGQSATATVVNTDGSVRRGNRIPLMGSAEVLLRHGPGLLAAWPRGADADPWPKDPAQPARVPSILDLSGPARALRLEFDRPTMLYGRGSAPLLAGLRREGQPVLPALYPQGARFAHYLPPGRTELLLLPAQEGELAGTLELQASEVGIIGEGFAEPFMLAPGGARLFGFGVTRAGPVGVGVQATPGGVTSRLMDERGHVLGEGVVQMPRLAVGNYILEVTAPPGGPPVRVRPVLVGLEPPPAGPPPEIRRQFRAWLNAQKPPAKKR